MYIPINRYSFSTLYKSNMNELQILFIADIFLLHCCFNIVCFYFSKGITIYSVNDKGIIYLLCYFDAIKSKGVFDDL